MRQANFHLNGISDYDNYVLSQLWNEYDIIFNRIHFKIEHKDRQIIVEPVVEEPTWLRAIILANLFGLAGIGLATILKLALDFTK